MEKFNLVKSLTKVNNITTLPFRKGLGLGRLILCLSLAIFGVNEMWGACNYTATISPSTFSTTDHVKGTLIKIHEYTYDNSPYNFCTIDNVYDGVSAISLKVEHNKGAKKISVKPQYSTDGSNWYDVSSAQEIETTATKSASVTFTNNSLSISASSKLYLRLYITASETYSASRTLTLSNLSITQARTLTPAVSSINIDETKIDGSNSASFDFTYSNMDGQTLIATSDNAAFVPTTDINLDCSGTKSINVTYYPTCSNKGTQAIITLKAGGITKTVTANASWALNDGGVTWNATDEQKKMKVGADLDISGFATAKYSDQGTISYSSSDPNTIAVVNGTTLTAKKSGTADITATISEGCKYKEASATTTFTVLSKATPMFTPSWDNPSFTKALKVGDKVTLTVENVSDGIIGDFMGSATGSNILAITRSGNTITIEAKNAGLSTATFTQTENSDIFGATTSYDFSVTKIANTLSVAATTHPMKVEEQWTPVISDKNSDATITTTSTDETIAYYDVANNKIIAQNTGSQSFNSKEVTITISQAATYKYTAAEKTITVTVNKYDNHISINGSQNSYATSCYMDSYAQIDLTATNTDYSSSPITAAQTAGSTIAVMNNEQTQVTSNHNLGTATWTISQPENYKYKAANATLTVNVIQQAEATCYVLNISGEKKFSEIGDNTYVLDGPGDYLTYQLKKYSDLTLNQDPKLQGYNASTGKWEDLESLSYNTSYQNKNYTITNRNITKLKWTSGGENDWKYVRNVLVTRATYLEPNDISITKTGSGNDIHPNEIGVGNLNISYSFANNSGDTKIVWDNANFKIYGKSASEGINLGDLGCSNGTIKYDIEYKSDHAIDADVAHVTIYNKVWNETFTITGKTIKRDQEIQWNTDIMIVGQTKENAAQTNSIIDRIVTYTSDNTEVIRVNNDANGQPTILEALQPGTANITVFSAGNNEYNNASDTKEITVTDKDIQYIVWNQSLMGLKMGDADVPLNASAYQPDSLNCATGGQRPITYSSANTAVVEIVDGNKLRIKGIGVTTVTASQAGGKDNDGHDFIAVTAEKKVVVRDPNAPCETYIYEQTSEVKFDLGWNAASHQTKTYEIDFQGQEPRSVNFDYKGEVHKVLINYYAGNLIIEQYLSGQWKEVKDLGEPGTSGYTNTGDIALDRNATKMRVKANDGMGYMYFKDCQVTLARYLEGSPLNTFETKVGSPVQQTLTVSYSNISGPLTFSLSGNSNFTIDKSSLDGVCGDTGSTTIGITYTPNAEAINEEATLTLADGENKTYITLNGKASVTPLHIDWNIPDNNSCYTIDNVALNATALTDLNVEVPNFVWFSMAQNSTTGTLTGNTLTFDKAGNANVIAQTTGDPRYTPAINVFKNWTVNLTPTEIVTNPEIDGEIVYGAQLGDIKLKANTGTAQNTINHQAVEGTFAITDGDISSAGEKTITVTFTPANTDMYASCTKDITVTVQKAQPNAIAHASDIMYGAAVESSELTNTGATNGTWTWTDEKKDQVLNVGTHEGLAVHFTPTDNTNYNEIDGTVSLTITAATPTLTWTAKPETAQVHEVKTFTASSTNTDNAAAITYSIISGGDCATINASTGEVTMLKAGTITVQASQAATTNFNAATSITTTCTISKAPTKITTAPTVGDVVYGTALNKIELVGGVAQNTVNNQSVEGTFAITDGDISSAGEKTITITFTPANTDMYAPCTKDISVTVQKAQPNAIAHASDIIYGATVESSELTNTGATNGTWTWTDEKKDQVLNVGTHEELAVHFTPTDQTNYNEIDGTVSLTVKKATATLTWTTAPTSADVKEKLTYTATSNHSESTITYSIISGADCATINANTGELTITKAGTITVQALQAASNNYEEATITTITTLTGKFENIFSGNGDWNDANNWSLGAVPTEENPDVVVSGEMTISEPISVGGLTIEQSGKVNIINNGNLTVNGTSADRETYGNLFVRNGGDVTISENANVKVFDFVVESSIGTEGQSISGQVKHSERVIYTNGAYIDINMDPDGTMDDTQWYGFTVPFPVDVQNGVARKEGDIFRQCTYGTDYMIAEYDMNQRLNTGKGWKYIQSGQLQPGHFYYFTVNGEYNTYSFKAADNTITIQNETQLVVNGEGANANWNAVGNTTLTYASVSGANLPPYVQTYINGESRYQVVNTEDAQFVVGCPFFIQASEPTTMVLNTPSSTVGAHYAPRRGENSRPMCVRIAETDRSFSDQMYLTAAEDALDEYETGRDLAKAGVGTQSAQLWINAYGQQLCAHHATLTGDNAIYDMALYAPKNGEYELSMPYEPVDGTLYLTQDGMIIWNLNQSPYPLTLSKGTTHEYGLLFRRNQPNAPTDIESMSKEQTVDKFIYQEHLYILKNGHLYNAAGATVKQNIRK